jgi:hypothetical protein
MVQPQSVPAKKGVSIWVWLAIGCVGILVLGGVAVGGFVWWGAHKVKSMAQELQEHPEQAIVKMLAAMDENVEVVSTDAANGKVTLRNKQTGQVMTVDMEDIKQGKINFETAEGSASMTMDQQGGKMEVHGAHGEVATFGSGSHLPDWVPTYPGGKAEGVFSSDTPQQSGGTFALTTSDSVDQVFAYYKQQLEDGGYSVTESRYSGSGGNGGIVAGESKDGKRNLTFTLATDAGMTRVAGAYSEKKG